MFINTHDPFCMVAVGVQGAGKSHTVGVVAEALLLPSSPVVQLERPMSTLVLHFDSDSSTLCELLGVTHPAPAVSARWREAMPVGCVLRTVALPSD